MSSRKLKALGYPKEGPLNVNDDSSVRDLTTWLEDEIFRSELPPHVLETLRAAKSGPHFQGAFRD